MSGDLNLIAASLAEKLGFPPRPAAQTSLGPVVATSTATTLTGELDGAPVTVVLQLIRPHQNEHVMDLSTGTIRAMSTLVELAVEARIPFRPRLDAGLAIQPVGSHAVLAATAAAGGFEKRFALRTADPAREQLVPEAARAALDRSFVGSPGPVVKDGGVTWTWRAAPPWPGVDVFADAIRESARAWSAIREAARTTPPPAGVEDAWAVLHGIDLPDGVAIWGCPAGIQGVRGEVAVGVSVAPYLAGGGWVTRARIDLPAPLKGTPRVVREGQFGWIDRAMAAMAGRSEIEVGDDAFDRRFAIRSGRQDELLALLDADVRKAMLALDGVLPVELDARGIEARGRLTEPRQLRDAIHATLALAGFLSDQGAEATPG